MAGDKPVSIKDAVYRLQLSLLEGIKNEDQLIAAGSIMSRSDYQDVVVERTIINLCGYPLCKNSLPSDRPHKGRYRISLKEHKVYDLQETYMYCCSSCVVKSRAFAGSLEEESCSVLNPAKIEGIMRLFEDLSLDESMELGKNGDLGLANLKIQEKLGSEAGGLSLEQWVGPSNAIEGYVPQRERDSEGTEAKATEQNSKKDGFFREMDFMSTIITQDEYSICKTSSSVTDAASTTEVQKQKGKETLNSKAQSSVPKKHEEDEISIKLREDRNKKIIKDELRHEAQPFPTSACQATSSASVSEAQQQVVKREKSSGTTLKSSLKSSSSKRFNRSVTWADEKVDGAESRNLCEVRKMENAKVAPQTFDSEDVMDDSTMFRFESAEACAMALSQAAEAVSSGGIDVNDAISEAGVIILPRSDDSGHGDSIARDDTEVLDQESFPLKWPNKPGIPKSEYFDPEDSWYDDPPEGFSLTLSTFATLWMALFAWVTSSSLAYIYGSDESSYEDYSMVNGREYPRKIVLGDGRSSEIKQTVEGCLARALPGLVADLRLPIPISTLEQGMAQFLDTMSFVDALPAFRIKQWQVIALLFIEALSVCRVPALTPHLTSRRTVLYKVFEGAQISAEDYETMRDLMIPLGRAPNFSAQSGA